MEHQALHRRLNNRLGTFSASCEIERLAGITAHYVWQHPIIHESSAHPQFSTGVEKFEIVFFFVPIWLVFCTSRSNWLGVLVFIQIDLIDATFDGSFLVLILVMIKQLRTLYTPLVRFYNRIHQQLGSWRYISAHPGYALLNRTLFPIIGQGLETFILSSAPNWEWF